MLPNTSKSSNIVTPVTRVDVVPSLGVFFKYMFDQGDFSAYDGDEVDYDTYDSETTDESVDKNSVKKIK
jgi:hypothetical protein